ncbi:MAG TPA: gfo/Idh/MocA family oxidoreductase, partial [Microbacterium sp.]|nr:gfo/Idh/MocA family oxidoreductase [Microbacterium sp.]
MTTAVVDIAVDTFRTAAHPDPVAPARDGAARRRAPASSPELVHVATPDAALAAFATGSSAICLSPFTGSVAVARRLLDAAEAAGAVGVVPFVARYHPMVRAARARIAAGELGMLLSMDCSYLQEARLSSDDSVGSDEGALSRAFAELGSHLCDLIEFVSGHRIARLTARTRKVFDRRGGAAVSGEDIASVLIETDGGALGTVVVSQMAAGHPDALALNLHGTAHSLGFASERPGELWIGGPAGSRVEAEDAGRRRDNAFDSYLAAAYAAADP